MPHDEECSVRNPSLCDLAREAQAGDDGCFGSLWQEIGAGLIRVGIRMGLSLHDAKDVLQDIALRLLKEEGGILSHWNPEKGCIVHWLRKCTARACFDFFRKTQNHGTLDYRAEDHHDDPFADMVDDEKAAECQEVLERALLQLDPIIRECVRHHYLENQTTTEIAAMYGCTDRTIRYYLKGARNRLSELIPSEYVVQEGVERIQSVFSNPQEIPDSVYLRALKIRGEEHYQLIRLRYREHKSFLDIASILRKSVAETVALHGESISWLSATSNL